MIETENVLIKDKHILVIDSDADTEHIINNFCGRVCYDIKNIDKFVTNSDTIIYLCGDAERYCNSIPNNIEFRINVIKELSLNYDPNNQKYKLITLGQVPMNIHNVGVYFRNLFGSNESYFERIKTAHQFQQLTESNKPSSAFRTGIYLTKITNTIDDEIRFYLLRCSSNLNGPTDNFREPDLEVIDTVNNVVADFFEQKVTFNHVLAQIYENKVIETNKSKHVERKAKIMAHSDKTKDMPRNGLIAFTTFYDGLDVAHIKRSKTDPFDYCYNDTSVLTRLRFRLKRNDMLSDTDNNHSTFKEQFDVTLYPNSVFIISLGMNRLYTHEIVPSILPIDKIPTRMGYVIRCSKTDAVFKDGQTYIDQYGKLIPLEEPIGVDVKELKDAYFRENTTIDIMKYGEVNFSLNRGDYERPIL